VTQPNQPINSGAPTPVQGVTGGPNLGGNATIDGGGNIVLTPPSNAVEIKKGPSALNVYEYFNSLTDYARLSLQTANGGPEVLGVFTQPPGINRDLNLVTSGTGIVRINGTPLVTGTQVLRYFAVGTTASPTTSSTSGAPIPEMTMTVNSSGVSDVLVSVVIPIASSAVVTSQIAIWFDLDGSGTFGTMINQVQAAGPNNALVLMTQYMFRTLAAGAHTIRTLWSTQSGTLTAAGALRYMTGLQFTP